MLLNVIATSMYPLLFPHSLLAGQKPPGNGCTGECLLRLFAPVDGTVLLLVPISLRRALFRRRLETADCYCWKNSAGVLRMALVGTPVLVSGGASLVFYVVVGRTAAVTVLVVLLLVAVLLWFAYLPLLEGTRHRRPDIPGRKSGG